MVIRKLLVSALVLFQIPILLFASDPKPKFQWEEIINNHVHAYGLSSDIEFKLAAYTELKGQYLSTHNQLQLSFGDLGSLNFYDQNCILKTGNEVYHLNRSDFDRTNVESVNEKIGELFEMIPLLGNHGAEREVVEFVDKHLARKNIEPFDKLFIRHILITHGRYDRNLKVIEFHTNDLPNHKVFHNYKGERIIKRYKTPLMIKLDENILQGFYIRAGGTVYVKDVNRPVSFATSEEYTHNVTAFKVFVQKLLVQSVQYISHAESARISKKPQTFDLKGDAASPSKSQSAFLKTDGSGKRLPGEGSYVGTLYNPDNWMVMMLGILRAQKINIGDRQILPYFINEPYFYKMMELLTPEEKSLVIKNGNTLR